MSTDAFARYDRRWRVHLVQGWHDGIGYNKGYDTDVDLGSAVRLYPESIRLNLDLMRQTDHYAADAQHRYTAQAAWQIEAFERLYPERMDDLRRRVEEGRLELTPKYLNCDPEQLGIEESARLLYFYASLARRGWRLPERVWINCDIPTIGWGHLSICHAAGIRYIAVGTNPLGERTNVYNPPYYLIGPDGGAVLVVLHRGYGGAWIVGEDGEINLEQLATLIRPYEGRPDYPWDSILVLDSGGDDYWDRDRSLTDAIMRFNERHAGAARAPLLINGQTPAFFQRIEASGHHIVTREAAWKSSWAYGQSGWSSVLRKNAENKRLLTTVESLGAAASIVVGAAYPAEALAAGWWATQMQQEHDTAPDNIPVRDAWCPLVRGWTRGAHLALRTAQRQVLHALSTEISTPTASQDAPEHSVLAVFNPLASGLRTDAVHVPLSDLGGLRLSAGQGFAVRDANGRLLSSQVVAGGSDGQDELIFSAPDVPALGYTLFTVGMERTTAAATSVRAEGRTLENEFYRVALNEAGALVTLWDKDLGIDLLETAGGIMGNDYRLTETHDHGMGTTAPYGLWDQSVSNLPGAGPTGPADVRLSSGPLFGEAIVTRHDGFPYPLAQTTLSTRIRLYSGVKRVEIENTLGLPPEISGHDYRFAFPFAHPVTAARVVYYEGAGGACESPDAHNIAGQTTLDKFHTQGYVALTYRQSHPRDEVVPLEWTTVWLSPDANEWHLNANRSALDDTGSTVYSLVKNDVPINGFRNRFGNEVDNEGPVRVRYAITSSPGGFQPERCVATSWQVAQPLVAVPVRSGQSGRLPPTPSFLDVPAPLVLTTLKTAEDGQAGAYILRLWNPTSASLTGVRVQCPAWQTVAARYVNLVEEDLGRPARYDAGGLWVDVVHDAVVSVRVQVAATSEPMRPA